MPTLACAPRSADADRCSPVDRGWQRASRLRRAPAAQARHVAALPTATALLRLAPALLAAGAAVPASEALPRYIRDKVAQTTAEREALRAQAAAGTTAP